MRQTRVVVAVVAAAAPLQPGMKLWRLVLAAAVAAAATAATQEEEYYRGCSRNACD